jgi:hypothetical protein
MTNSNKASAARNGALGQEPVASTRDVAPSRAETGNLHGKEPVQFTLSWPDKVLQSNSRAHWAEKAKGVESI